MKKDTLFVFLFVFLGHSQAAQPLPDTSNIQTRVGSLTFTGNRSFSAPTLKKLGLSLAPKFFSHKKIFFKARISYSRLRQDTTLIRQWYESNGFLKIALKAGHEHGGRAGPNRACNYSPERRTAHDHNGRSYHGSADRQKAQPDKRYCRQKKNALKNSGHRPGHSNNNG